MCHNYKHIARTGASPGGGEIDIEKYRPLGGLLSQSVGVVGRIGGGWRFNGNGDLNAVLNGNHLDFSGAAFTAIHPSIQEKRWR